VIVKQALGDVKQPAAVHPEPPDLGAQRVEITELLSFPWVV
jgi:hypothetical protein